MMSGTATDNSSEPKKLRSGEAVFCRLGDRPRPRAACVLLRVALFFWRIWLRGMKHRDLLIFSLLMRFEPETSRSVTVFVLIIQSELMVIFEAARNDLPANHPLTEQM